MIRTLSFIGAWLVASGTALVQADSSFEPANFNVTAALKDYGVEISSLPALTNLAQRSIESSCLAACASLDSIFGSEKVLARENASYTSFTDSFWSNQQAEVRPSCIFKPGINKDVAIVVLVSRLTRCPFAAKSGGHAAFRGASSSPGGITIWFTDMNDVSLNDDRSVASIGPGNLWGQVYKALEPYGLAVVGGRESSSVWEVLLLAVALPFTQTYMVVTASGRIVTASANHFSDLYWALRGGGNNLGLVTKFNLYTIPSSTMRGTTRAFEQARLPEVVSAFTSVARGATSDGNAQQYVAFARMQGVTVASAELSYALNTTDPPIFKPYRDIPALADITESRSLVEYAEYINDQNPDGHREMYWTVAAQLDESFARWAAEYFFEVMPQAANISGGNPVIIYQALTEPMLANMTKFAGNALGLDTSQGPLILFNMAFWWDNAADDNAVYAFIYDYFKVITEEAKKRGIAHQYIYMNYGSQFQDVISGYGAESKARLQKVAATYDPRGVYQTLQPGYFKLNGAPVQY
ncbi:FAD binding domain protein [Aspergillus nomiae NRRL 13137]|uniref:FAD binding domain protein n=1 Tax=Aspergillus nomiae NRRL (strain ATCC 15546 / NRRL 13137 / CBS 260.88 / M93) TaxID=1509407 RepID=A0A0L1JBD2_ASPN3|nr:FAD binding domain protein [Aspergillus nomiae NRRL 13137]KNG89020.1 FAD binding domain protein [Aspergillus nomiae NRRL 13137]